MVIYSHSRLSTFEQCPQKFKLHYIDKIETEVKESVEAFMGVRIHETLEKLYSDLRYQKKNTLEELIGFLDDEWENSEEIRRLKKEVKRLEAVNDKTWSIFKSYVRGAKK